MTTPDEYDLPPPGWIDDPPALRRRLRAWGLFYKADKDISVVEMENRLGVGSGTGNRLLSEGRCGVYLLQLLARALHKSTDSLLTENPPTKVRNGKRG